MLGHKTSLNKFQKIEIISNISSNHNAIYLEINHKKNDEKHTNTWKLNNMLLKNEQVNNRIKEEIKRYFETSEHENTTTQDVWYPAKAVLDLSQETRKISNKLTLHLQD